MSRENYRGKIIIAQPRCISNFFAKSTILIGENAHNGAWGVIINRIFSRLETGLGTVMKQAGIEIDHGVDYPLYVGGPLETNRINVVHSMDWSSHSTLQITEDLGITSDLSVMIAIAGNRGPEHFRACVGICRWGEGQLEGEMAGIPPWLPQHRWLHAHANIENVFEHQESFQWQHAILDAAKEQTKAWL